MLSRENRDTFPKHAHLHLADMMKITKLATAFAEGEEAYRVGVSYQWCPKLIDSVEEHAWQRGWDSKHFGDIKSISAFDGTPQRVNHDE